VLQAKTHKGCRADGRKRIVKPDDGHYRPKHVVKLLEYIHLSKLVVLIDYTILPLISYTHNGDGMP